MEEVTLTLEALANLTGIAKADLISQITKSDDKTKLKEQAEIDKIVNAAMTKKFEALQNDATGRGKRERMTDFEKNLKTKYGIDAAAQGEALVEMIVQAETAKVKTDPNAPKGDPKKPVEVTEEQIKKHPFFVAQMQAKNKEVETAQTDFETYKNTTSKQQTMNVVRAKAKELFLAKKPILSKDQEKANRQVENFVKSIAGEFKIGENGVISVLDSEGNPAVDPKSYNAVTFKSLVEQNATAVFDFHLVDPNKSSPGLGAKTVQTDNGQQGDKRKEYSFPTFKTTESAMEHLQKIEDLDERRAFTAKFEELVVED